MSANCPFRPHALVSALALAAATLLAPQPGRAAADLVTSELNGSNGLRLDGIGGSRAGFSVALLGDVNDDGIDDLLVGAYFADKDVPDPEPDPENPDPEPTPDIINVGHAYVVFGRSGGFAATLDLAALDGSNGFRLEGAAATDEAGYIVADAGDLNGDGIDDFVVCDVPDPAHACHVVFGRPSAEPFSAVIDLGALDGSDGFRIGGIFHSVAAAGDVDGDGLGDLLIANFTASPDGRSTAGSAYVLFGDSGGFSADVDVGTLDGSNGFRIDGGTALDRAGGSVAAAGDVNDDGVDDLIIGAVDPTTVSGASEAYVVFGRASTPEDPTPFAATLDLSTLDGSTGFAIGPRGAIASLGSAVAGAGDVNGDGIDDVVVGAPVASPGGLALAGSGFVVFGRDTAFPATLAAADLDGSNGFRIDGAIASQLLGYSVSGGDLNGDGFADLLLGVPTTGSGTPRSVLVFGRSGGFPAVIAVSSFDGSNGLRIADTVANTNFGIAVSAGGDLNDDGTVDLLIGAFNTNRAYVVFGNGAPLLAMGADGTITSQEDDSGHVGSTIAELFPDTVYLDTQALAGAAIDTDAPSVSDGVWQYRANAGAAWTAVPTSGLSPSNALLLAPEASLRFLPDSDFFGSAAALNLRAWDGADASAYSFGPGQDISASIGSLGGFSTDANRLPVPAEVLPINDAPSFVAVSPPEVNEDAGAQSLTGWASAISPGPANEAAQSVSFEVSSVTNPALFAVAPSVSSTGALTYTLAANANGASGFLVRVVDDGGTANGGIHASASQVFVLSVRPINDAPSFTASNPPASLEDGGPQTVIGWASGFVPGPADEADQTVAAYLVSAVGNPGLFSVAPSVDTSGTLTYTAAPGVSGTSTFSVQVRDDGGTASGGVDTGAPQPFVITINPTPPTDDRIFCGGFEDAPCT